MITSGINQAGQTTGTVLACMALREFAEFASETEPRRNVVQAIKQVAARLGNIPFRLPKVLHTPGGT
jgi:hypothetical protein